VEGRYSSVLAVGFRCDIVYGRRAKINDSTPKKERHKKVAFRELLGVLFNRALSRDRMIVTNIEKKRTIYSQRTV